MVQFYIGARPETCARYVRLPIKLSRLLPDSNLENFPMYCQMFSICFHSLLLFLFHPLYFLFNFLYTINVLMSSFSLFFFLVAQSQL